MSSITERKLHFNLDRGTAPNQLNYSNNWMSYKGIHFGIGVDVCVTYSPFLFDRLLGDNGSRLCGYQNHIFSDTFYIVRNELDINQFDI